MERASDQKWREYREARDRELELEARAAELARPFAAQSRDLAEVLERVDKRRAAGEPYGYGAVAIHADAAAHLSGDLRAVLDEIDDAHATCRKAMRAWLVACEAEKAQQADAAGVA